jgi:hypothetical protein
MILCGTLLEEKIMLSYVSLSDRRTNLSGYLNIVFLFCLRQDGGRNGLEIAVVNLFVAAADSSRLRTLQLS